MQSTNPSGIQADVYPSAMLSYEATMGVGASRYRDALDALDDAGLPSEFIQTGGMNAALLVRLEGGRVILITDSEDALSWDRADQDGWGVGLYRDESLDGGPDAFDSCPGNDAMALVDLVRLVLGRFFRP